jgi:predicted unusual protein kinase regulating ubiquinone biosynthesis (AarF/ABC1/UbiB family)
LQQIFEDRFFHADPHPGNLFIQPGPPPADGSPRPWTLVFCRFRHGRHDQPQRPGRAARGLFAVVTRDGARVVKAYQILGVLLPNADLELLEQANNRVFERFLGQNQPRNHGDEVRRSPGVHAGVQRAALRKMPFQLPENFILLGRCLGHPLRHLRPAWTPEFNIWDFGSPLPAKSSHAL